MTVDAVFYHTWNAFSKSTKRKQAGISALLATRALLKRSFCGLCGKTKKKPVNQKHHIRRLSYNVTLLNPDPCVSVQNF